MAEEWLLKRAAVHVVASDAHDPKYRRPTLLEARAKIAKLAGEEIADMLVSHNPAAIVEGKSLPYQRPSAEAHPATGRLACSGCQQLPGIPCGSNQPSGPLVRGHQKDRP